MSRSKVLALLAGAALVGWVGRAQADCTMDSECQGDLICQEGRCVAAPPSAPAPPAAAAPAAVAPAVVVTEPPAEPPTTVLAKPAEPERPRHSVPMMVSGAVMIPVGALVLAVAVLTSGPSGCQEDAFGKITPEERDRCSNTTRSVAIGLAGTALVAGGVPLVVIGAKRVPVVQARVTPWLSPSGAGLGLRLDL